MQPRQPKGAVGDDLESSVHSRSCQATALQAIFAGCATLGIPHQHAQSECVTADHQTAADAVNLILSKGKIIGHEATQRECEANSCVATLIGHESQKKKAGLIAEGSNCYGTVQDKKDVLIHRLQQPCWGLSIPVENAGQAAFAAMLRHAAAHPSSMKDDMQSLQWVNKFNGKPAAWSAMLEPAPELSSGINAYHKGLSNACQATEDVCKLLHQPVILS